MFWYLRQVGSNKEFQDLQIAVDQLVAHARYRPGTSFEALCGRALDVLEDAAVDGISTQAEVHKQMTTALASSSSPHRV